MERWTATFTITLVSGETARYPVSGTFPEGEPISNIIDSLEEIAYDAAIHDGLGDIDFADENGTIRQK